MTSSAKRTHRLAVHDSGWLVVVPISREVDLFQVENGLRIAVTTTPQNNTHEQEPADERDDEGGREGARDGGRERVVRTPQ